jgi:CRISPR-associated protein Csd2
MAVRGLYVFEHKSALGNAPAHKLFDLIRVESKEIPRSFADCRVTLPEAGQLPEGVTFRALV